MKKAYNSAGYFIVAVWVILIAVIIRREYFAENTVRLDTTYIDESIESRDEWTGIYLNEKKIGYAHSVFQKIEEGYRLQDDVFLDMTVMDVPQKIEIASNAVTDRNLTLSVFSFRLRSGVIGFSAYGNVDGRKIKIRTSSGGALRRSTLELKDDPVLSSSLKYFVLKNGLEIGRTFNHHFFDPLTMSNRDVKITVAAREDIEVQGEMKSAFRVDTEFSGIRISAWLDEHGETLREETPMGLVRIREDKRTAMRENWGERPDILAASSIQVDRPFSTEGLHVMKIKLENVSLEGFMLDGGRQTLENETMLTVRLERIDAGASYVIPYAGDDLDRHLAPTMFIQSDSPMVKSFAAVVLDGETDALRAVRKMLKWVYTTLQKTPTMSIPNAVEVLKTKQGDCNEHAVLLAALCRAAGIPARLCTGIVYLDGHFYYHAWNEVFLGSWITADATMNQFPADVTHVKFMEGDISNQIDIIRLIGKLKIEVVEYR